MVRQEAVHKATGEGWCSVLFEMRFTRIVIERLLF